MMANDCLSGFGRGTLNAGALLFLAWGLRLLIDGQVVAADDPLAALTERYCLSCHSGDEPEGEVRLDAALQQTDNRAERLRSLIRVLKGREMPPAAADQPPDQLREAAMASLRTTLAEEQKVRPLKRLTRSEYTNTVNDLFSAQFDLSELLPPDPPGHGFSKWGESQRMSPHQVESYLRTARFVADRLLPDQRPAQQTWDFDIENFRGTGRGDFQTETEHALTTHYPWRSILYFVMPEKKDEIFQVPEFGRYWIQADVKVHFSDQAETLSLSTGDSRFPTNIRKLERTVLPADGSTIFIDRVLKRGAHLSFTYDSAATWNTGGKRAEYKGRQVRFTRVRITGPITNPWPTAAHDLIFDKNRFESLTNAQTGDFTKHVIDLLVHRELPESDEKALTQLTAERLQSTGIPLAAARSLLTALLCSPHFIYKQESAQLDNVALVHRVSSFLWNSGPDSELLTLARDGEPISRDVLREEVERMLADSRSERFCSDFTREWLSTDRIDDIGPDDRVHDAKKVTFMTVRELAKEPAAFFRELLQHDLSMVNFIDSDFVMVNDETAGFYGLGAVRGREFRPAKLPENSERGGLMGQAGLLKLTSGKHSTSPILRGTWVLRNIYCESLNPPPGVAAMEPDIRAAETVKEVIELHKTSETCNRCHRRIDPLGLALEHYDEMGLYRKEYRHVETEVGNKTVKLRKAPIDSSAVLPDGREVSSLRDLKAVLLKDREKILKGVLSKLASYALARELGVIDEAMIDEIYSEIEPTGYSLRAAVHAIVAHDSFRNH